MSRVIVLFFALLLLVPAPSPAQPVFAITNLTTGPGNLQLSPWNTGVTFNIDDVVTFEHAIYVSQINNNTDIFPTDFSADAWRTAGIRAWDSTIPYTPGKVVMYRGRLFFAGIGSTGTTPGTDSTKWTDSTINYAGGITIPNTRPLDLPTFDGSGMVWMTSSGKTVFGWNNVDNGPSSGFGREFVFKGEVATAGNPSSGPGLFYQGSYWNGSSANTVAIQTEIVFIGPTGSTTVFPNDYSGEYWMEWAGCSVCGTPPGDPGATGGVFRFAFRNPFGTTTAPRNWEGLFKTHDNPQSAISFQGTMNLSGTYENVARIINNGDLSTSNRAVFEIVRGQYRELMTTGSAGGKKVVCVDTSTGKMYASSTSTDCSN